jgi:hemoglobin
MHKLLLALALVFSAGTALADDAKKAPPAKDAKADTKDAPKKSLYDRLGGLPAIKAVVHDFVKECAADKRINARFAKTKVKEFEKKLVDQVCEATGGKCKYKGKNMADAHKGMKITEEEWTATVEDLVKALDKHKVPQAEKDELLGALGPMKPDIVGK